MGLLDYIKANTPRATTPRVKPGKVFNEGLLNPNAYNKPAADRFKDSLFGGLGIVPGVGDVAAGMEAADLWNRGDKGMAALAGLGMLPIIPSMVGLAKRPVNAFGEVIPPTKYELAHEEARKNAVKMLGLPENNTYIDRAKAMADTPAYHGTAKDGYVESTDIKSFDPTKVGDRWSQDSRGFSFTNDTNEANYYARGDRDYRNPGEGEGAVYPVFLNMKNKVSKVIPKTEDTVSFWDSNYEKMLSMADEKGKDSIQLIDPTSSRQMYVSLNPSKIRSRFAAFDPARAHESDLLAGLAPYLGIGGLLSLGLLTPEEAQDQ